MKPATTTPISPAIERILKSSLPPRSLEQESEVEGSGDLDSNRIASWLDGGMAPLEAARFAAAAAVSRRTRRILQAFENHKRVAAPEFFEGTRRSALPWALAAMVVMVATLGLSLWPSAGAPLSEEASLAIEAQRLGFKPLSLEEALAAPPRFDAAAPRDTTLQALWPSGHVLERNVLFQWSPPTTKGLVIVRHVSGTILGQARGAAPLRLPPDLKDALVEGQTYIWELSPLETNTQESDELAFTASTPRIFTMAGNGERDHFREFLTRVGTGPLAKLATAHYALRLDHLRQAEEAAREHLATNPTSRLGLATLWQVLSRLESPEAASVHASLEAVPATGPPDNDPAIDPSKTQHQSPRVSTDIK